MGQGCKTSRKLEAAAWIMRAAGVAKGCRDRTGAVACRLGARLMVYARLVKIEHSVFALPFAFLGAFTAAKGWFGWERLLLLVLAMVAVRSFAMTVNRLLDLPYDRHNPRTARRELVTGEVGVVEGWLVALVSAALFVLACLGIGGLAVPLCPVALAWSGLYSLTKRFTWASHWVLGSVLGLAPLAGSLAATGSFTFSSLLFGIGVTYWVAGFDILYSAQDRDFDLQAGLHSLPARFGLCESFLLAAMSHVSASLFFLLGGAVAGLGAWYFSVWAAASLVLMLEHRIISPYDLKRLDMAFFTMNGLIAVALFGGVILDLTLG